MADLGNRPRLPVGYHEIRLDRTHTIQEERDAIECRHLLDGRGDGKIGQEHGSDEVFVLTGDLHANPACREDHEIRTAPEQAGEIRRRGDDLLEIIEDEEHASLTYELFKIVQDGPAGFANAERTRDRRRNMGWVGNGNERNEVNAVGEVGDHLPGDGNRESGLANTTGTDQVHEANARHLDPGEDGFHLGGTADEESQRARQVDRPRMRNWFARRQGDHGGWRDVRSVGRSHVCAIPRIAHAYVSII